MDLTWNYNFNILFIGDSEVGKTSFINRFVDEELDQPYPACMDFKTSGIEVDEKAINLRLWDASGLKRYRQVVLPLYKCVQGICFIYDITDVDSFQEVTRLYEECTKRLSKPVPKILIGNKADLESLREVSYSEGLKLAGSFKMQFIETSAKTGAGVDEAIEMIARKIPPRPRLLKSFEGKNTKKNALRCQLM